MVYDWRSRTGTNRGGLRWKESDFQQNYALDAKTLLLEFINLFGKEHGSSVAIASIYLSNPPTMNKGEKDE